MEGRPAERDEPEGGIRRFRPPTVRPRGRGHPSVGRWLWEWTKSIFIALILFLFIRTFVVEAFQIPTASMENTLLIGDFLLVNKMVYGAEIPGTDLELPAFDTPARGDVIVFEPPDSAEQPPRTNYVKRIIGMPGDTLRMRRAQLFVNGFPIEEPYVKASSSFPDAPSAKFDWQRRFLTGRARRSGYLPTRNNWGPLVVPADHYFVMGDNRSNSEDSRYWGFVPRDAIKGRPMLVYYSYDREPEGSLAWLTEIRWRRILRGID
ncbi:signal peptidase I [Candidatus Palauibacter sp.]|uniref:signal peptidase I n=1 Tax=Candidatus Palauibacter sp. TaxID=3101350 RepID=UPI003B022909